MTDAKLKERQIALAKIELAGNRHFAVVLRMIDDEIERAGERVCDVYHLPAEVAHAAGCMWVLKEFRKQFNVNLDIIRKDETASAHKDAPVSGAQP